MGIDVGLNRLATLSTGEGIENQAFLKTALKQLRRANKRLHRRPLGSKNREKARRQVARLHYRITCLRDDVLHKLTTQLASCYGIIGIEDLNLRGLLKNRKLARSFSDAALGKLLTLLASKMKQRGGQVIKVDRFFPSSKTCHCCGWKWEGMQLSDRVFLCQNPHCAYYHLEQDRDHNASLNILQETLRLIGLIDQAATVTSSDDGVNAGCGRGIRPKMCRHIEAPTNEAATTKDVTERCLHRFYHINRSRSPNLHQRYRKTLWGWMWGCVISQQRRS